MEIDAGGGAAPAASRWSPAPAAGWSRRWSAPAGGTFRLPLDHQEPAGDLAQRRAAGRADPRRAGGDRACPLARAGLVGLARRRRTGAHFVTTYHGAYGEDLPFKRHYNAVMARGEMVIAASRFIAELVHERHGVPIRRASASSRAASIPRCSIPTSVVGDRLAPAGAVAWRLPDGMPTVVLPGRLTALEGAGGAARGAGAGWRGATCACVLVGADQGAALRRAADPAGAGARHRRPGARWSASATTCRRR